MALEGILFLDLNNKVEENAEHDLTVRMYRLIFLTLFTK